MPFQSVDQAAFWKGFSIEDHLLTVAQLSEQSRELNFPIWLALTLLSMSHFGGLLQLREGQAHTSHY